MSSSFGNPLHKITHYSLDLKPLMKEIALSKRAKNMTEFKKFMQQQDKNLEVISLIDQRVRIFLVQ